MNQIRGLCGAAGMIPVIYRAYTATKKNVAQRHHEICINTIITA